MAHPSNDTPVDAGKTLVIFSPRLGVEGERFMRAWAWKTRTPCEVWHQSARLEARKVMDTNLVTSQ